MEAQKGFGGANRHCDDRALRELDGSVGVEEVFASLEGPRAIRQCFRGDARGGGREAVGGGTC